MFKVSFNKDSKKVETLKDRLTIVTLTGKMKKPKWWMERPSDIDSWIILHESVGFENVYNNNEALITVSGKSVCSEQDTFNAVLGERIAESRAKLKLYKFLRTLCRKIQRHYQDILYGDPEYRAKIYTSESLHEAEVKYTNLIMKESEHLDILLKQS